MENTKKCNGVCGLVKNLSEFSPNYVSKKTGKITFRSECKSCISKKSLEYYSNNKEKCNALKKTEKGRATGRIYYHNNKEKRKESSDKTRAKNKDKIILRRKISGQKPKNKEKKRIYFREWQKKLRNSKERGPSIKLRDTISKFIRQGLKNQNKYKSESILCKINYTINELKLHIESQWESWMNWDNYGKVSLNKKTWQLDHIIPQSMLIYDSMDHINFLKCWSLTNLRPLESMENIKKSDHIHEELRCETLIKINDELEERANNNTEFRVILDRLKLEESARNNKKAA